MGIGPAADGHPYGADCTRFPDDMELGSILYHTNECHRSCELGPLDTANVTTTTADLESILSDNVHRSH